MSEQPPVPVDSHTPPATYSNYFRVSGSAEELILDCGLNPNRRMEDGSMEPIVIQQRLAITWGSAERLVRALLDILQRRKQTAGPHANANRSPAPPSPT